MDQDDPERHMADLEHQLAEGSAVQIWLPQALQRLAAASNDR